jgi:CRISP-associated protein Cas1
VLKRTLFFSNPFYLSVHLEQLVMENKETNEKDTCPLEDIGFIVIENNQCTFSAQFVQKALCENIVLIFCDETHTPCGMTTSFQANTLQQEVYRYQLEMSLPLKKKLWQQTVIEKIGNQARAIKQIGNDPCFLQHIQKNVLSNDSSNKEGEAARLYWKQLFESPVFKRERFGNYPNDLLNYGYAILRACMTRSIVGSGLLSIIGIHHKNKYNSFCLSDDLMEPYRPYIDLLVYEWCKENPEIGEITKEGKAHLLKMLTVDCKMKNGNRPLMLACTETATSFIKCLKGEEKTISFPIIE